MNCVICKHGETVDGTATVTLTRGAMTIVFRDVPARVCDTCGEEYVDEAVAEQLLRSADASAKAGIQVEVRTFIAA
ncbi:MAG TPA: type II toxin-antitoxin system MqsA family antitoxin [Thermomicrobiales bacterium]|nr:type II toxin-antitoxin system MqsA family antitoxin [Thermomicrobiales bacterium]